MYTCEYENMKISAIRVYKHTDKFDYVLEYFVLALKLDILSHFCILNVQIKIVRKGEVK